MDVELRPIRPDDEDRLERLFYRLSPETVYRRFFQPVHHPRRSMLHHFANVDHGDREAIVAVQDDEIVGVARYDMVASTGDHEMAVLVEDAWQGQGIGHRLLEELSRRALDRGITSFVATVLAENEPVRHLIRDMAPGARFSGWGAEREVVIPLVA